MVMVKNRDAADDWCVYHFGGYHGASPAYQYATALNSDGTHTAPTTHWGGEPSAHPTTTIFSIGTHVGVNTSTEKYIAYCFHSTDMTRVSAWGGNNLADGYYVWTGFAPAFIMIKQNAGTGNWVIIDNKRNPYNNKTYSKTLYADVNDAEKTATSGLVVDFLANGYKMRGTNTNINGSADFYIAIAFAATPFKYANAQ